MNRTEPRVLACVDRSSYADHVTDAAAWAATRLAAPLELLHVIDLDSKDIHPQDRSGALGIDPQESLLAKFAEEEAALVRNAREQGRLLLRRLRERAQAAGTADADVRLRHGSLVETLTELQAGTRLVVMGRRGESAGITVRDLGRRVERVVRALDRPVLTVTQAFSAPRRVLVAFDGGAASRHALAMVGSGPLFRGIECHLLMVGDPSSATRRRQLDGARSFLEEAGLQVVPRLVQGDPETTIARVLEGEQLDMLVMGAYTHSPLRSLLLGSRTTELLRASRVPTLLLR